MEKRGGGGGGGRGGQAEAVYQVGLNNLRDCIREEWGLQRKLTNLQSMRLPFEIQKVIDNRHHVDIWR